MERCQSDNERLALYKELKLHLRGIILEHYPARELQWLVATLWNRGCRLRKLERQDDATKLMSAALELESLRPANEAQKQVKLLNLLQVKWAASNSITFGCNAQVNHEGLVFFEKLSLSIHLHMPIMDFPDTCGQSL